MQSILRIAQYLFAGKDGMLDLVQFTKGLSNAGVNISSVLYKNLFQQMDDDMDGIVNLDGELSQFAKRADFNPVLCGDISNVVY